MGEVPTFDPDTVLATAPGVTEMIMQSATTALIASQDKIT